MAAPVTLQRTLLLTTADLMTMSSVLVTMAAVAAVMAETTTEQRQC